MEVSKHGTGALPSCAVLQLETVLGILSTMQMQSTGSWLLVTGSL